MLFAGPPPLTAITAALRILSTGGGGGGRINWERFEGMDSKNSNHCAVTVCALVVIISRHISAHGSVCSLILRSLLLPGDDDDDDGRNIC